LAKGSSFNSPEKRIEKEWKETNRKALLKYSYEGQDLSKYLKELKIKRCLFLPLRRGMNNAVQAHYNFELAEFYFS
jgi:hypothetical protein